MKLPVVKVNWRWCPEGYIYGVLFPGGRMIVAWDNEGAVDVRTAAAFPRHELTGEEVEMPDDFIEVALRFHESRNVLESSCPELLKQRSLTEQGGTPVGTREWEGRD